MHEPRERHMQAIHKILRYLKSNPGKGLLFGKEDTLTLKVYIDVGYEGFDTKRKSTSVYYMFLGESFVT